MTENEKTQKRSVVRAMRDDVARETFLTCRACGQGFRHKCPPAGVPAPPTPEGHRRA